ncbi:MAG TPA: RNA polymerase sigma factor SigZ [Anaerolineaceae bacterium]
MERNFEALWVEMHGRICRFICSRVADPDDAEDILQEVFLRIHTHLETVRDVDRLESWMYQVARNGVIDYYRGHRWLVPLTDLPVEDELSGEDNSESMAPYVRKVVQALPEPYRQAIVLTEYEGLSQKALAERLGISGSGARSRVQRAREKIKEILLACGHFEFDMRGAIIEYRQRCCQPVTCV